MPEQTDREPLAATSARPGSQRFQRNRRLLTASDFNRVFEQASTRAGTAELFLLAAPTEAPNARLGFIVARKHVRRAVKRNMLKRIVRENFRTLDADYPPLDIIVMARKGADRLSRPQVHEAIRHLLHKLRRRYNQAG